MRGPRVLVIPSAVLKDKRVGAKGDASNNCEDSTVGSAGLGRVTSTLPSAFGSVLVSREVFSSKD